MSDAKALLSDLERSPDDDALRTRDGRVLYFWVPTELFGARGLRESVVKRMKVSTSRRSLG